MTLLHPRVTALGEEYQLDNASTPSLELYVLRNAVAPLHVLHSKRLGAGTNLKSN